MRQRNDALQDEITRLQELSKHYHSTEEVETNRLSGQPPIPADLNDTFTDTEVGLSLGPQLATGDAEQTLRSGTEILDLQSLKSNPLRVNARPWTTIGNDGIVSELISSFFVHDNCFYMSFIDQQCFLDDMRAGDVTGSDFCSPLLINAICALRCVSATQHYTCSIVNMISSPPHSALKNTVRYEVSIFRNAFLVRLDACWISNTVSYHYRQCNLYSSCTPVMPLKGKTEEACNIVTWLTRC